MKTSYVVRAGEFEFKVSSDKGGTSLDLEANIQGTGGHQLDRTGGARGTHCATSAEIDELIELFEKLKLLRAAHGQKQR